MRYDRRRNCDRLLDVPLNFLKSHKIFTNFWTVSSEWRSKSWTCFSEIPFLQRVILWMSYMTATPEEVFSIESLINQKTVEVKSPSSQKKKSKIGRKSILTPEQMKQFVRIVAECIRTTGKSMDWRQAAKEIQEISNKKVRIPRSSATRYLHRAEMLCMSLKDPEKDAIEVADSESDDQISAHWNRCYKGKGHSSLLNETLAWDLLYCGLIAVRNWQIPSKMDTIEYVALWCWLCNAKTTIAVQTRMPQEIFTKTVCESNFHHLNTSLYRKHDRIWPDRPSNVSEILRFETMIDNASWKFYVSYRFPVW